MLRISDNEAHNCSPSYQRSAPEKEGGEAERQRGSAVQCSGGEIGAVMRPLSTLVLFVPFVAPQENSWNDPWIQLTTECQEKNKCDLTLNFFRIFYD